MRPSIGPSWSSGIHGSGRRGDLVRGAILAVASLAVAGSGGAPRDPLLPTAGCAVAREIAPGESHSYRVRLRARELLHAQVTPAGGDVAVDLLDPSGATALALDDPLSPASTETVFFVAAADGEHRLVVRAAGPGTGAGKYRLRLAAVRRAGPRDLARAAALAATARGLASIREDTAESARRVVDELARAAPLWRRAGEPARESMVLNHLGYYASRLGDTGRARSSYEQALGLARAAGSAWWEARTRLNLGELLANLGEVEPALAELRRALALFRRLGDRRSEAVTLSDMGEALGNRGEHARALALLGEAAAAARAAGDDAVLSTVLHNTAGIHHAREEWWRALALTRQALALTAAASDRRDLAASLNQIGHLHDMLGEKERALDYYQEALALLREVGDRPWEATALQNVAGVHLALGDPRRARALYLEALATSREIGDRRREASLLSCLGQAHAAMGEPARARQLFAEALAIRREAGDRKGIALTLRHLARLDAAAGDAEAARAAYLEVLATARDLELSGMEAAAHDGLAGLALARGDLAAAQDAAETAVSLGEDLRARIPGEDLRTTYFSGFTAFYRRAVQVLMARHRREPGRGFDERALAMSERSRARTLLDALADPAEPRGEARRRAAARVAAARRELAAEALRQHRLSRGTGGGANGPEAKRVRSLLGAYEEAAAGLAALEARAGAPVVPDAAWRRGVLDPGTLLVEIALGPEESTLWAVSPDGIESHSLPPAADLEAAARRLHALANARNRPHPTARAGRSAAAAADRRFAREAVALARTLLGPVTALPQAQRLVFVVDGALDLVPFAALALPAAAAGPGAAPLASRYEVVSLPSASFLTALRARRRPPPEGPALAIFADPLFEPGDPRLAVARARNAAARGSDLAWAAAEAGLASTRGLPRLPYTRREAAALARMVPPGQALVALGLDATRERATSPEAAGARILHFATHALVHRGHPQLSGIALSLVDRAGRERDGFLRLAEIAALDLRCELVVLSACQTAAGTTVAGEGGLTLARGFLEAGAGGVVASLWPVDEVATARFMELFYGGLLGRGLRPAAALRDAQLALAREERWRSPYYWGAFVLQGDWR